MDPERSPRRVLVTGASRGIGRAIALELAAHGFAVSVNYRTNEAAARATVEEIRARGARASALAFDVARPLATEVLAADVAAHGAYWGVVLNAGITADAPLAAMKREQWDSVLRTDLDGFYNVLQPLVMPMVGLRDGGRIVTIGSVAGLRGNRGQANYAAAKAGLAAATKSLALELAKRAITVNCVAPGFVETDMTAALPKEELARLVPLGRFARAEEVAALVGFLFGARAGYITGQVLAVDGGLT